MKNIHLVSTNKPSRLLFDKEENRLLPLQEVDCWMEHQDLVENQNIYITSDEEIKWDDWVYCPVLKRPVFISLDGVLMLKNLDYDSNGNSKYKKEWLKKIILTTDPFLIKNGVQAIDDEFLEWFIKNPSCESIKVNDWLDDNGNIAFGGDKRYQICNHLYDTEEHKLKETMGKGLPKKYLETTELGDDEWVLLLDEFRKTYTYRKSNGQLLFPKFFEWLSSNYEVPKRKLV